MLQHFLLHSMDNVAAVCFVLHLLILRMILDTIF